MMVAMIEQQVSRITFADCPDRAIVIVIMDALWVGHRILLVMSIIPAILFRTNAFSVGSSREKATFSFRRIISALKFKNIDRCDNLL